ncbi:MAG: DUF3536 domain-containing protein [Deltaproteobacteria bacterium]|jgi:hypothetical protein|nr:DUF3536 domain-containing protein [Deltaproteobacteria bacterium]
MKAFLEARSAWEAGTSDVAKAALELMEGQLMCLYTFTSRVWFFNGITGLEPVRNNRCAARAIVIVRHGTPLGLTAGHLGCPRRAVPDNAVCAGGEALRDQETTGSFLAAPVEPGGQPP